MPLPVLAIGPILKAIGGFFRAIPLWAWLAFAVLAAAFVYGEHKENQGMARGMAKGLAERDKVKAAWAASVERGKRELARREELRAKITVKTETVYVDRIRVVREKGQTLIQRIPAMVPADACLLPAGWRLSHNHAAAGTVPDPASGPDGSAAAAEPIAWRPWDSRVGATGRNDRGRKLQPVSPDRRAAARIAGVDSRAGGR